MNQTMAFLQRVFLVRPCADTVFRNRSRPCLQYQIKRCSAPCVRLISEEDYAQKVVQAKAFLSGRSRDIQDELAKQMNAAAERMDYEEAGMLRDRIRMLTQVQQEQGLTAGTFADADVIALARDRNTVCIQVFFFRGGQNFGNLPFFPAHVADVPDEEVLAAFIGQFYQTREIPKQIVTSHAVAETELLMEALSQNANRKIEIFQPTRGDKVKTVEHALRNAKQSLERKITESMAQGQLLEGVQKLFALANPPKRIEVYDNSHISGTNAIGAMVVAGPEGYNKKPTAPSISRIPSSHPAMISG